ncbi:hypothetical protein Dimus_018590 [Dionaea muscipula]
MLAALKELAARPATARGEERWPHLHCPHLTAARMEERLGEVRLEVWHSQLWPSPNHHEIGLPFFFQATLKFRKVGFSASGTEGSTPARFLIFLLKVEDEAGTAWSSLEFTSLVLLPYLSIIKLIIEH